jgi:hypothetical protein
MRQAICLPVHPLVLLAALALASAIAGCNEGVAPPTPRPSPTAAPSKPTAAAVTSPTAAASPLPSPPAGTAVSFQSLARGFVLGGALPGPTLRAATDPATREALATLVDERDRAALDGVDLTSDVVLAAFWGVRPYGGFSITVTDVVLRDDELTVAADLRENDPAFPAIEAATLPYHLVTVERRALPELDGLRYRLISGQEVLATGRLP